MWTRGDKEVDERLHLLKKPEEVIPICFGAFILVHERTIQLFWKLPGESTGREYYQSIDKDVDCLKGERNGLDK
jgi:hypothetical protein